MGKHEAADRVPLAHEILQRFHRLAFHGRTRFGIAAAIACAARRVRFIFPGRFKDGLQPGVPGVPHMETLSRRHGR